MSGRTGANATRGDILWILLKDQGSHEDSDYAAGNAACRRNVLGGLVCAWKASLVGSAGQAIHSSRHCGETHLSEPCLLYVKSRRYFETNHVSNPQDWSIPSVPRLPGEALFVNNTQRQILGAPPSAPIPVRSSTVPSSRPYPEASQRAFK